jgi:hypothetical protein
MTTNDIQYVVLSELGYYADKQPSYEWSFTTNLEDAKFYKSELQASKRIEQAKRCRYRDINPKIIKVEVATTTSLTLI